jgi:hypothetical protein
MTATYRFDEMTGKKANTGNLLPAGGGIPVALSVEKDAAVECLGAGNLTCNGLTVLANSQM